MDDEIDGLTPLPPYKIFPLGDGAITVDFGNIIDEAINKKIISLFHYLSQHPFYGMIEIIPAYSSLTVFYDVFAVSKIIPGNELVYDRVKRNVERALSKELEDDAGISNSVRIPVCYDEEFGVDLKWIAEQKNISVNEIIQLHCSKRYRIYMLGFLPGFAYMGEVIDKIAVPRKSQPQKIFAGMVGIAGKQTGIYPFNSPGGWQIIGSTPLKLFDANRSEPCLLKAGDEVEFYSITKDEFENYQAGNS